MTFETPLNANINFAEIHKLRQLVEEAGWEHSFERFLGGYALILFNRDTQVGDAVLHGGSYGHDDGLLEIVGKGVRSAFDDVEGYLSADEVMERWRSVME